MKTSELSPGDHHYTAYVGPANQYDFIGASQFRLLCTLGLRANHKLLSAGITSFQDASPRNDKDRWHWFEDLKTDGSIASRITMLVGLDGLKQHQAERFTGID